jgi:hypothetical protein
MSKLVTPHHHTSISDWDERISDQTETFVQSKHTNECLWLVPLSLSIDDRSIVCVNREIDGRRWLKFTFDFLLLTSQVNTKKKGKSKFIRFPFKLTSISIYASLIFFFKKKIYSTVRCNRIIDLQKKKVIDTSMKVSWRQSIFTFPVL